MLPFGKAELERQHCEVQERSHRNFSSDRPRYHTTQVGRSGWQRANKELESMVAQRTTPLRQVNEQLLAETGKLEVNTRLLDLEKFCRDLVEDVQLIFGNLYKITFVSQGNCQKTYMDEKLLRSILENLLTNAIKYSPSGRNVDFSLEY